MENTVIDKKQPPNVILVQKVANLLINSSNFSNLYTYISKI